MDSHFPLIFLALITGLTMTGAAHATFPPLEIAHWDLDMTDDRNDPEYLRINELVAEKKYDTAMSLIEKKILSSKDKSAALFLKGALLNEMGKYREALTEFRKGYKIEARHPAIQFSYCQIYRNLGDAETSLRACKIAVHQHPQRPESHFEYAQTLQAMGNMKVANQELETASKLDPKDPLYPFEQGKNYFYLNQLEEAENAFKKALARDANHFDSAYQLAYLFAVKKEEDNSKTYLKRIMDSGKDHQKVKWAEDLMSIMRNNQLDKMPTTVTPYQYHLSHSHSLYKAGQYGLALIETQTAARLRPGDKKIDQKILTTLVRMATLLLRLDLIEKTVQDLIKLAGEDRLLKASGYQELGDMSVMRGDLKLAKQYYEKAKVLGDPFDIAKISLAELPKDLSNIKKGRLPDEYFIEPIKAWHKKGEIFDYYGMYDRAIAIYSEVLKMDPNHLMSKLNAAAAYYKKKEYEKTIALLERMLLSQPRHEFILEHHILLAKAYTKSGDPEAAIKNLERTKQLDPNAMTGILSDPAFEELKRHKFFNKLQQGG